MIGNALWNAKRVQHFLRELGVRPTKWEENIVHMAEMGRMSVAEFLATDPISYGVRVWGADYIARHNVKKILGVIIYNEILSQVNEQNKLCPIKPEPLVRDEKQAALHTTYEKASAKYGDFDWKMMDEAYEKMDAAVKASASYERTHKSDVSKPEATTAELHEVEPTIAVANKNEIMGGYEQEKTKWKCPTCTAVWRTKAKTE